jgi:hypothetical protein
MPRTNRKSERRMPIKGQREPRQATLHHQGRLRRFVPAQAGEWLARQCAQDRAHRALQQHGVLIRLHLTPRADTSKRALARIMETLRREGFIVWRHKQALVLTGEPTLAITFMDMAARAQILRPDLRNRLEEILAGAAWLRLRNREHVLRSVPSLLAHFVGVGPPA